MFRARDVLGRGLLTPDALRSSAWRRLYRGVYADASLPDSVAVRIAGAVLLVPPTAVFSGRTAAFLLGAGELAEPSMPVEVTIAPAERFGPVAGLRIRQARLRDDDVRTASGRRCTTALRTALDLARHEPWTDAVPALDVLLRRGLVLPDELRTAVSSLPTARGTRRARAAVALADGRAESPPESRVRVLLALAGIPAVPQHVVRSTTGRFLARVDLAYPDLRIAIEYDGVWHADRDQLGRDRRRLNALVAEGWVVLHLTASDLRDPEAVVARVRQLIRMREIGEPGLSGGR